VWIVFQKKQNYFNVQKIYGQFAAFAPVLPVFCKPKQLNLAKIRKLKRSIERYPAWKCLQPGYLC